MENTVALDIKGARGTVEVEGVLGVLVKILVDGSPVRSRKGIFTVPRRNGTDAQVRVRGLLPGFQKIVVDGETVLNLGAHVPTPARFTMFAPLLLVFAAGTGNVLLGTIGMVLAVLLFFMSIMVVKNPDMPAGLRIALPLVNTLAAAVVILVFAGVLG